MDISSMIISRQVQCRECGGSFCWQWECPAATVPTAVCPACKSLIVDYIPPPELALRMVRTREANSYDGPLDWKDEIDDRYPSERGLAAAWSEIFGWGYDGPDGGGDNLAYENTVNQVTS